MAGKYIELVGVAGAGKTAIAKMLVEEALRRGVAISPRGVVGRNLRLRVQTLRHCDDCYVAPAIVPHTLCVYEALCAPTRQKNKT